MRDNVGGVAQVTGDKVLNVDLQFIFLSHRQVHASCVAS